ncbi:CHAD domain-containing protein [Streptomyces sp. NPDC003393]
MAQRHLDPADPAAAGAVAVDALSDYLRAQATEFLRALRLHHETGGGGKSVDAVRALRRAARRISGTLHTFGPLLDEAWAEQLRAELAWTSGTLAREHAYQARLERLLQALHRLSPEVAAGGRADTGDVAVGSRTSPGAERLGGTPRAARAGDGGAPARARSSVAEAPGTTGTPPHPSAPTTERGHGNRTLGAAKAGALLDRRLTLARTRAHSTALQALGSSRFHAVADKVAVLAGDVPLARTAHTPAPHSLATAARQRLADAVAALPLVTAGRPYNAAALVHGLAPDRSPHPQDTPWHQVRLLLRLHRYAQEALHAVDADGAPADARLLAAGRALDRHRDASEAAAAAAAAARTPRIAPSTAYALGVLHADQRHEVEGARFAFQQAWQTQAIGAD